MKFDSDLVKEEGFCYYEHMSGFENFTENLPEKKRVL